MTLKPRTAALLATFTLLAGCISTHPVPFAIEHTGTLPPDGYTALDKQAAAAEPKVKVADGTTSPNPEPYWVYSFKPGFNPRAAVLSIGPFTGARCRPAEVAAELPARLQEKLSALGLFSRVTTQPEPGAYLLSGTVTRTPEVETTMTQAGTQVEATVTRDGSMQGTIQLNVLQMQPGMAAAGSPVATLGTLLVSSIMSAAQGSRANFVAGKFADIFEQAAGGKLEAIDISSSSRAYLYPAGTTPVQLTQRDQILTSAAACTSNAK